LLVFKKVLRDSDINKTFPSRERYRLTLSIPPVLDTLTQNKVVVKYNEVIYIPSYKKYI